MLRGRRWRSHAAREPGETARGERLLVLHEIADQLFAHVNALLEEGDVLLHAPSPPDGARRDLDETLTEIARVARAVAIAVQSEIDIPRAVIVLSGRVVVRAPRARRSNRGLPDVGGRARGVTEQRRCGGGRWREHRRGRTSAGAGALFARRGVASAAGDRASRAARRVRRDRGRVDLGGAAPQAFVVGDSHGDRDSAAVQRDDATEGIAANRWNDRGRHGRGRAERAASASGHDAGAHRHVHGAVRRAAAAQLRRVRGVRHAGVRPAG